MLATPAPRPRTRTRPIVATNQQRQDHHSIRACVLTRNSSKKNFPCSLYALSCHTEHARARTRERARAIKRGRVCCVLTSRSSSESISQWQNEGPSMGTVLVRKCFSPVAGSIAKCVQSASSSASSSLTPALVRRQTRAIATRAGTTSSDGSEKKSSTTIPRLLQYGNGAESGS